MRGGGVTSANHTVITHIWLPSPRIWEEPCRLGIFAARAPVCVIGMGNKSEDAMPAQDYDQTRMEIKVICIFRRWQMCFEIRDCSHAGAARP
jgi:hypothetical protein